MAFLNGITGIIIQFKLHIIYFLQFEHLPNFHSCTSTETKPVCCGAHRWQCLCVWASEARGWMDQKSLRHLSNSNAFSWMVKTNALLIDDKMLENINLCMLYQ